jgi:hypothetical protein
MLGQLVAAASDAQTMLTEMMPTYDQDRRFLPGTQRALARELVRDLTAEPLPILVEVEERLTTTHRRSERGNEMLTNHVALVTEDDMVAPSELTSVSAALQQQATHDFGPPWGVEATVDAFMSLYDVPLGYWPVIVRRDIHESGAAGVHMDQDGQPFALVQYGPSWSLTASHECLEMLADPFGNRLRAGPLPDQAKGQGGQGRVDHGGSHRQPP